MKNSVVMFFFSVLVWEYPCMGKLFQKVKIICWSWNLEPRLTGIYNSMVIFFSSFLDRKYPFWVNLVQKFEIWYLDYFEYVKFDGDIHLFCFRPFSASFAEKIRLAFWCYLINISAIDSQRREASDFSCFN